MYLDIERIQRLREEYVGQPVTVDAEIPELNRFAGRQGTVQTITQTGLALVQFEGDDRTRYDIELDYLKVVDLPTQAPTVSSKPEPEAETDNGEQLSRLEKARLEKECEIGS
ncbi:MAG: hypothetical protein PVH19_07400 [Planctomycetia bacterium]|jgi:hypothetical protein